MHERANEIALLQNEIVELKRAKASSEQEARIDSHMDVRAPAVDSVAENNLEQVRQDGRRQMSEHSARPTDEVGLSSIIAL